VDDLESRVQELLDREAIRDVLARYCRGVDREDAESLEVVYHDDALDSHGEFVGGPKDFVPWAFGKARGSVRTIQHSLGTIVIDLQGDVAYTEAYFSAPSVTLDDPPELVTLIGRYVDRFERRNGEWRIARRVVVKDARNRVPLVDIEEPYEQARRDRDDWVYRIRTESEARA